MRAIYFCDLAGEPEQEIEDIKIALDNRDIPQFPIEVMTVPPFKEVFDVLFFDWGGMSIGNSMLECFCREIIRHANNHPGTCYIMNSRMTEWAMRDALDRLSDRPDNIFIDLDEARSWLIALTSK